MTAPTRFSFITGFPRSRTAWLSELLTCRGHSFCFHEGTISRAGELAEAEYTDKLCSRNEPFVADSNSGLLLNVNMILNWPGAQIFLIEMDEEKSRQSHEKFLLGRFDIPSRTVDIIWSHMRSGYERLVQMDNVIKFRADDLSSADICRTLVEKVAPGFPWDEIRFDELRRKNIQQNLHYWV